MKTQISSAVFSMLVFSSVTQASPCDPLMIFNNQTSLKGYYSGNDASGPMPEINSIYVTYTDPQQQVWSSSTCHTIFEYSDKNNWDAFSRVLTNMTFYSDDAVQRQISCSLPANPSLKNTKSMTTTVSKNSLGQFVCQITREEDKTSDAKFFAYGVPATFLVSGDTIQWSQIQAPDDPFTLFRNMTFGKNNYIAVGSNYFTSTDGVNWQRLNLGSAADVIWANNQFYSVGNTYSACNMPICTSQDGLDWKPLRFLIPNLYLNRITKNAANTFVAVGTINNDGVIVASTDGVNWSKVLELPTMAFMSVTWGNNQFVAVGTSGNIYTSTDGLNWKNQKTASTEFLQSVAWGNDKFVIVGGGVDTNVILTSSDGIAWTSQNAGTVHALHRVNWMNNEFIAVGDNGTILTSADGIRWTAQQSGTANNLWSLGQL